MNGWGEEILASVGGVWVEIGREAVNCGGLFFLLNLHTPPTSSTAHFPMPSAKVTAFRPTRRRGSAELEGAILKNLLEGTEDTSDL